MPFIFLLGTLFTLSGGLFIKARFRGTPLKNTLFLLGGTILANFIGTTGACVLLTRPLLQANQGRLRRTHLLIFLIFLVGNIGGSLTPLGDPPLFIGYLEGIPFFWPISHMIFPFLSMAIPLLLLFYGVDKYYYNKETSGHKPHVRENFTFSIEGKINFILLLGLVAIILLTSFWKTSDTIPLFDVSIPIPDLTRDLCLLFLGLLSILLTPKDCHYKNKFSWEPFLEIVKIFFAIFITIIPILAILEAKEKGILYPIITSLSDEKGVPLSSYYFWATGLFSAFLDNAPTYLVFFKTAGGDPSTFINLYPTTLLAISCGAVFMGALTYIGNAPNFMVKVLAEEQKVKMPNFFMYCALSCVVLLPLLGLVTYFFFL